jgi:hypothetical protein
MSKDFIETLPEKLARLIRECPGVPIVIQVRETNGDLYQNMTAVTHELGFIVITIGTP